MTLFIMHCKQLSQPLNDCIVSRKITRIAVFKVENQKQSFSEILLWYRLYCLVVKKPLYAGESVKFWSMTNLIRHNFLTHCYSTFILVTLNVIILNETKKLLSQNVCKQPICPFSGVWIKSSIQSFLGNGLKPNKPMTLYY